MPNVRMLVPVLVIEIEMRRADMNLITYPSAVSGMRQECP